MKPEWMPENPCNKCPQRNDLEQCRVPYCKAWFKYIGSIAGAKALAKWGEESCTVEGHHGEIHRKDCPECWQQMLKELEEYHG